MAISLPRSLVFQDRKNEEDFLEGENSFLNRELLELLEIIRDGNIYTETLPVMNEAWYIAKWVFMQKEPKVLHFERRLKQYINDENDFEYCYIIEHGTILACYILKRQKELPAKISEFLPEMEKVCLHNSKQNTYEQHLNNFLINQNNDGYNTNLYLEVEGTILYNDIEKATNHFYMEDIKKILPYYGNINEQLKFANCVEKYSNHRIPSAEDLEIYDYPF